MLACTHSQSALVMVLLLALAALLLLLLLWQRWWWCLKVFVCHFNAQWHWYNRSDAYQIPWSTFIFYHMYKIYMGYKYIRMYSLEFIFQIEMCIFNDVYTKSVSQSTYISLYMCCSRYKEISHSSSDYDDDYYSCMFMILMAIGFVWSEPLCIEIFYAWVRFMYGLLFDERNSPLNDAVECARDCFQWMLTHACTCEHAWQRIHKPPTTQPTTPIINSAVDTFRLIAPKYTFICSIRIEQKAKF